MSPRLRPLRNRDSDYAGVSGAVRVDKRTKNLTKRLRPGEIAVIDHIDLDKVSAEALVACRPAAVINVAPSISGRYPNLGPEILVAAGIPLLDNVGKGVMERLDEGDSVHLEGNVLLSGVERICDGDLQDEVSVREAMAAAREGLNDQLESFAENTMTYLLRERELLLDGIGVPDVRTEFEGRHALIVVRGYHYKEDIQILRHYIREYRPILIGVDGGADALIEARLQPDMIVGDMDSASEATLRCGAELVVHAYPDGRAPGRELLEELGLAHKVVPAPGTSQDVAMLIAGEKGAQLIVSVGSQFNLVEFLDKNRRGMSSTFLTRLRLGEKIVDAKGVSRLYRPNPGIAPVALILVVGLLVLAAVVLATPGLRDVADLLWLKLRLLLGGEI